MPIERAVEHLVALQAQEPWDPYYQLWSRLQGFDPLELARLLEERRVVRATSMLRTTIHLMTADDWLALRPVLQVVSDRGFATGSPFGRQLAGMDIGEVLDAGREALAEQALTASQLRKILGARWPDRDADFARVRGPLPAAARADDAARGVGEARTAGPRDGSPVARARRRHRHRPDRPDPALPARVRTGQRDGHPGMVVADEAQAVRRGAATAAPHVPRRERQGAVRCPGWSAARPGHARPAALPAHLRQHRARAQGPKRGSSGAGAGLRRRQGPVGRGVPARGRPGGRVRVGRLADGPR